MKNKFTEKKRSLVIYIIITTILVILAGLLGYHLTKRYKETITDTYNTTVSNLSEKFYNIQDDVANGISRLEESVDISSKVEGSIEEMQSS
ncbi:MAG: hypothetical protein IIT39_15525 [Clostridia bacterium]|nr:hypothetical protein [Clostridia bacterium]